MQRRDGDEAESPSRRDAKRFDVVGFGFNTFDHVCVPPRPPGYDAKQRLLSYFQQPGGQVPTALVALQRWGLRTAYVGPCGDDEGGRLQRSSLGAEGVDLSGTLVRAGKRSQTSIIFVDAVTGERSIFWQRPDHLVLAPGELDRQILTAGRALLLDADDMETALCAARWGREDGSLVVLDVDLPKPGIADLLAVTDVLIVSQEFARRLTGKAEVSYALRAMRGMGPRLVAVTLGGGGAVARSGDHDFFVAARRVPVVDSTSAGDLFHAGCLYGLLRDWPIERVLRFAAAAAALECTALGGRAAIPALSEVTRLAAIR